jgi:hypothetical protein
VWVLGVLLLAPWLVVLWQASRPAAEPPVPTPPPGKTAALANGNGLTQHCKPGPWGELEYSRILIEPPEDFVMANYPEPAEIMWLFKGFTAEKLSALWRTAGLDETQLRAIDNPASWQVGADGIVVRASKEFILGLNTAARTKIYTILAAFPENRAQNEPFRFRAEAADEWFDHSGLSDVTVGLVKKLLYRRGTSLIFSDYDVALPLLESPEERTRLVKTLSRKSTLLLELGVKRDSDIEALARYWGRGPRSKDVKPLLQSIARLPDGFTIDVAHMLPQFARSLLYTYPLPSDNPLESNRDCYWTALNFFNATPDNSLADIEVVRQKLLTQYYPVPGESTFGDVLIFVRPDGTAVHGCVFIADDIVFTKNGISFAMPWILMTLADVRAFYPADPPLEIRRYRAKNY